PVDPQTGYPVWYSDGTVKLQLCYMAEAGCLSEPPNPAAPASYPDNFPEEAFWFAAEAEGGNLGLYEAALEAAHANDVVRKGDQNGFARLRFRLNNLVANKSYTITHPYGVNTFVAEPDDKNPALGFIKQTLDVGDCAPTATRACDWAGVGESFLGDYTTGSTAKFLKQVGAAPGTLGSITTARAVTGAPSGTNAVIVTGPNAGGPGVNSLRVSTFTVQGLIFNGADGAPSSPDLRAASDTGRSSTDNITKDATPTLGGTVPGLGAAPATVQLMVDGAATPAATTATVNGRYSVALPKALAAGTHKVKARIANPAYAIDPATGAPTNPATPRYLVSQTLTFTVDTAAPPVKIGTSRPSDPSLDRTPTFRFSSTDPAASFACQLLPSNRAWDKTCASPKTYDAQINGDYTFKVRATDAAGNTSVPASYAWRIGRTDTFIPKVVSRTPGSNATGVIRAANTTVEFNERVGGINGTSFSLKKAATGAKVSATVNYNATTRTATLNPRFTLAANTRFTASLGSAIKDKAGNPLKITSWTFTTKR
ncbi:Ig-like domain-containing protein, partial [Arthrobacter sp. H14]|uniref:Ig-like domain-containing protein n=1 Tax=Arthrobacter sp. H14 TaxID=1312959 RepID=UPI00047B250C